MSSSIQKKIVEEMETEAEFFRKKAEMFASLKKGGIYKFTAYVGMGEQYDYLGQFIGFKEKKDKKSLNQKGEIKNSIYYKLEFNILAHNDLEYSNLTTGKLKLVFPYENIIELNHIKKEDMPLHINLPYNLGIESFFKLL